MKHLFSSLVIGSSLFISPSAFAQLTITPRTDMRPAPVNEEDRTFDAERVLRHFLRPGAASTAYDEDSLSDTTFDFQALMNHTCFNPNGPNEIDLCRRMFGDAYRLDEVFQSGQLLRSMFQHLLELRPNVNAQRLAVRLEQTFQRFAADLDDTPPEREESGYVLDPRDRASEDDEAETSEEYKARIRTRTGQLWDICGRKYGAENQGICYMQNQRLARDSALPVHERNVYYRTRER